eukprot:386333-Amphidinium_carterae.1
MIELLREAGRCTGDIAQTRSFAAALRPCVTSTAEALLLQVPGAKYVHNKYLDTLSLLQPLRPSTSEEAQRNQDRLGTICICTRTEVVAG